MKRLGARRSAPTFDNPYAVPGRWWKVGLHMHTTNSDGHQPAERVIATYKKLGYDAIAITDHNFVTRVPAHRGRPVLIPAAEISGPPDILHLGATGAGKTDLGGKGIQTTIDRINEADGVAVVAHPAWSGLVDKDLLEAGGYVGIELWNQVAQDLNGTGRSVEIWDHLLAAGLRVWGFADDDAHFGWQGKPGTAWLWVKAASPDPAAILGGLRRGSFHSTFGPRILDLRVGGGKIVVRTSPAVRSHLISSGIGSGGLQFAGGRPRTTWTWDIMKDQLNVTVYARIEVLDASGRTAWSNPLFVEDNGIRFW